MELNDVLAQVPDVRPVDDERARFYLENRTHIETWASLRRDASRALRERLADLAEPLNEDLTRLGETDAQAEVVETGKRLSIDISRLSWHAEAAGSPVRISIEVLTDPIAEGGVFRIDTCVIAKQGHPGAGDLRAHLAGLTQPLRQVLGREWKNNAPRYLAWKWVECSESDVDAAAIVHESRAQLIRLWASAAPLVQAVFDDRSASANPED